MNGQLQWGDIWTGVLSGAAVWLVTSAAGGIVAFVRKVPIRRFVVDQWQLFAAWALLLIIESVVYRLQGASWAILLLLGLVATVLCARYRYIVLKFSGQSGGFSGNRDGPWQEVVECDPLYHSWKPIEGAKWIWIKQKPTDQEAQREQSVWHRLEFWLLRSTRGIGAATLTVMVDDYVDVYANGQLVAQDLKQSHVPTTVHLAPFLHTGKNVILMKITNAKGKEDATGEENPAGIIYALRVA